MKSKFLILIASIFLSLGINAQEGNQLLRHFSVSAGLNGSYAPGIRFEVGTSLSPRLNFRAGLGFTPYTSHFKNSLAITVSPEHVKIVNHINENNVKPFIDSDFKVSSTNAQFLVDFFPNKNGIFHLSAGIIVGGVHISSKGALINRTTDKHYVDELRADGTLDKNEQFPIVSSNGLKFQLNDNGSAQIDTYIGNKIKPYLGIGLGRTIPNNRVGFKVELGAFYSGDIKISSDNLFDKNNKKYHRKDLKTVINEELDVDMNPEVKSLIKKSSIFAGISPSINFQLIIKLF